MSTLVQSLSDFLNVLIQAFNFSSTFPALIFVLLSRLYLLPLFPEDWPVRIDRAADGATQALVTIILVALIAYFLDAANLSIIRFFEGYSLEGPPKMEGTCHLFCKIEKPVREFCSETVQIGVSQHWIVVPGHIGKRLESLCSWLNIDFVRVR